MDPDSVSVDSGCDSIPGIPVTVPVEFEFWSEFHRNGNYNLAGTSAKFPFPRNSRNHPDSRGFHLEYVGDCKELMESILFYVEYRWKKITKMGEISAKTYSMWNKGAW